MASEWTLSSDGKYYEAECKALLPVDPDGVAVLMLKPFGVAIGSGVTAIEKGDPGLSPTFLETVNVTPLAFDDPTPDSMSLTQITPPSSVSGGVYQWNATSRTGEKGDDGASVWDPTDLSATPVAGQIPAVNATLDGFDLVAQKFPEVFYPGVINNVPSGNVNYTMAQINIPARPFARRVSADGFTVVTGGAADVRVNLLARLGNESGGNIVGRCLGIAQTERLIMSPGKPIEVGTAADTYDQIAANASAIVYIRTEAGSGSYTASASTSQFRAVVTPL